MRSLSFILTYGYSFLKSLLRIRGIRNISPPAMAPPIHFYNVNLIKPSSNKYFAGDLDYTYVIYSTPFLYNILISLISWIIV